VEHSGGWGTLGPLSPPSLRHWVCSYVVCSIWVVIVCSRYFG